MAPILAWVAATAIFALPSSQTRLDVYPNIDLKTYQALDGVPEYDWIIRPGGDLTNIEMLFPRADHLHLDAAGNLIIRQGSQLIRHSKPVAYQTSGLIPAAFVLTGHNTVVFSIAAYDRHQPLIIDPRIEMGASFGGRGSTQKPPFAAQRISSDTGRRIALDAQGNIYVAGITYSYDFPVVNPIPPGAPSCPHPPDCAVMGSFVAKLDPSGNRLLYSTWIGTPDISSTIIYFQPPQPVALAVDPAGNAYAAAGTAALAVKLDPSGQLVWTRGFGDRSNIVANDIAFEPAGKVVIVGGATSGPANIFLTELDAATGSVTASTDLGPASDPHVAIASDGSIIVAAKTNSPDWLTTPGVFQPKYASANIHDFDSNAILLKLISGSSNPVWATYLGGSSNDAVTALAAGPDGDIFVTGSAYSPDFPFTPGGNTLGGLCGGFTARINATATALRYSVCAGGSSIAVDGEGNAFVNGPGNTVRPYRAIQSSPIWTRCPEYGTGTPTQMGTLIGYQLCQSGGLITALNDSGDRVLWATYLGKNAATGIAVDDSGNILVTGNDLLLNPKPIAGTASVSVARIAPDGEPLGLAVTNAASFAPGIPAPGALASLFVTGASSSDIAIKVDGIPAPILSVSGPPEGTQQVNFQVPFEMNSWWLEVQHRGKSTFIGGLPVTAGIFTHADGSAAVQHATDFSQVTSASPIRPGEIITIYGTGFGPVTPPLATGAIPNGLEVLSLSSPLAVTIGQSKCSVLYAGAAPGFIGGYQINCRVGDDVPSGGQPLQLTFDWVNLLPFQSPFINASNKVIVPVTSILSSLDLQFACPRSVRWVEQDPVLNCSRPGS